MATKEQGTVEKLVDGWLESSRPGHDLFFTCVKCGEQRDSFSLRHPTLPDMVFGRCCAGDEYARADLLRGARRAYDPSGEYVLGARCGDCGADHVQWGVEGDRWVVKWYLCTPCWYRRLEEGGL